MSLRLRSFIFFILTTLLIVLVIGPPLSIAKNLPTVCNIFDKKTVDKAGSCGHRAMFSKIQDKTFDFEAVLFFEEDLESSYFLITQSNPISVSFPFGNDTQSIPLRC